MPSSFPTLAAADIWSNLAVLLIIGGVILFGKLMDYLKGKLIQTDSPRPQETVAERKIRKVIEASRNRGRDLPGQKSTHQNMSGEPHSHLPGNYTKKQAVPTQPSRHEHPASTVPHIASSVSSSMTGTSEEQAASSIQSLSNAEKEALSRLQHAATLRAIQPSFHIAATATAGSLRQNLSNAQALRTAILYQEILGKPVALKH